MNLMRFLTTRILRKKRNTKGHLLIKQYSMAKWSFMNKYCDKSFIYKPAFFKYIARAKRDFIDLRAR